MKAVKYYAGWGTKALALKVIATELGLEPKTSEAGRMCLIKDGLTRGKFTNWISFDPEHEKAHYEMLLQWYAAHRPAKARKIRLLNKINILSTRYARELIHDSLRIIDKYQEGSATAHVWPGTAERI